MTVTDCDLEGETVLRWNRADDLATLATADPTEAKRWTRLGYPVEIWAGRRTGRRAAGRREFRLRRWRCWPSWPGRSKSPAI